jgi:hypothetical protein
MGFLKRKRKHATLKIQRGNKLYYRYQNLSEMWKEYAELLSNTDLVEKEKLAAGAMETAAKYKRSAIVVDEELLMEEERKGTDHE